MATVLPTISSDLNSASGYVWIGGAYLLGNSAAVNIWANLSDIFGRKPILLAAVLVFFVSSIICATAPNIGALIVGRGIQGIASGGLLQLVMIVISDLFSIRRRSLFMGLIEIVWVVAAAVGPVLGGALTQQLSWRWIFWINLPISGVAFIVLLIFLNVHNPKTPLKDGIRAVDWSGSIAIIGLSIMLLMGLNFGGVTFSWSSSQVICLIVFGGVMLPVFILCERYIAKMPLMPMRMFRNPTNVACFVVTFCHGAVVFGTEWYLPLFFQSARLVTPLESGILILPLVVIESIMSLTVGIVIHKTGRYVEIIWAGNVLMLIGIGLYIDLDTSSSLAKVICYQMVAGLGTGMLFFAPLLALQTGVSAEDTATSTATLGFIRNIATSASVVLGGVIFQNSMAKQGGRFNAAGLPMSLQDDFDAAHAAANVLRIAHIDNETYRRAIQDAFSDSIKEIWYLYTALAAVGVVSCIFIRKQVMSKQHTEHKTGLRSDVKS